MKIKPQATPYPSATSCPDKLTLQSIVSRTSSPSFRCAFSETTLPGRSRKQQQIPETILQNHPKSCWPKACNVHQQCTNPILFSHSIPTLVYTVLDKYHIVILPLEVIGPGFGLPILALNAEGHLCLEQLPLPGDHIHQVLVQRLP